MAEIEKCALENAFIGYKERNLSPKNISHTEKNFEEDVPVTGSPVHQSFLAMVELDRPLSSSSISSLGHPWATTEFAKLSQAETRVRSVPSGKGCPCRQLTSPGYIQQGLQEYKWLKLGNPGVTCRETCSLLLNIVIAV